MFEDSQQTLLEQKEKNMIYNCLTNISSLHLAIKNVRQRTLVPQFPKIL